MRSDLVFAANDAVSNRFLLCRVVSLSTRRFHADANCMNLTINDVLERVGANDMRTVIAPPIVKEEPTLEPDLLILAHDNEF